MDPTHRTVSDTAAKVRDVARNGVGTTTQDRAVPALDESAEESESRSALELLDAVLRDKADR